MIKIGVIYGGMSTEHDISVISGKTIINNLDKSKYKVYPIYIDKSGNWFNKKRKIKNIIKYLKKLDLVFPVLHGKYGEDGTIQGLFEMFKIPYIGCNTLSSSICMDKFYTKLILENVGIKQAKYICISEINNKYFDNYNFNEIDIEQIINKLKFPIFVKPCNSGSSIGINKAYNKDELIEYINYAFKYDDKILLEENINGREIECAVLGSEISRLGEVISDDFYSYDSKYEAKSKLLIPTKINKKLEKKIKIEALKVFNILSCKTMSRIDFFVKGKEIYVNEINTMPGFTEISMYPKLWENVYGSISNLLDKIIELELK